MRSVFSISTLIFLVAGGVSVRPVHAGIGASSFEACCCAMQQAVAETDSCCESEATKPADKRAEACPCHLQSPDNAAVPAKSALAPNRGDSHDTVAVPVVSRIAIDLNDGSELSFRNSDAGPPGPSRPIRLLLCSLLN